MTGRLLRIGAAAALAALACAPPVSAQRGVWSPFRSETGLNRAARLVVSVTAAHEARSDDGAGIIVGFREDTLFVVTAEHVLAPPEEPEESAFTARVSIGLLGAGGDHAARVVKTSRAMDLALLAVPASPEFLVGWTDLPVSALGEPRRLRPRDPLYPIGCPGGTCWLASEGNGFLRADATHVLLMPSTLLPGNSGGGIFTADGRLVGMAIKADQPGIALRADVVLDSVRAWSGEVTLRQPPPNPFRSTLGLVVGGGRGPGDAVMSSGILEGEWIHGPFLLRAAGTAGPDDRLVELTGGLALYPLRRNALGDLPRWRQGLLLEGGYLWGERRYDVGGYEVTVPGGTEYVPFFDRRPVSGPVARAAVRSEFQVQPDLLLGVSLGYAVAWTEPRTERLLFSLVVRRGRLPRPRRDPALGVAP